VSEAVVRVSALAVILALLAACTPLPVSHPEYWAPENGATDYPGASRDAGAIHDAARTEGKPLVWLDDVASTERGQ
jgi:hypothetical protein